MRLPEFKEFTKLFKSSMYVVCDGKVRINKSKYTSAEAYKKSVEEHLSIGWLVQQGYIVLDFDTEIEAVEKVLREIGVWRKTPIFRTPKGGLHVIFKDRLKTRTQKIGAHLACGLKADLRVAGKGYVVTPFINQDLRQVVSLKEPIDLPIELIPLSISSNSEQFIQFPIKEGLRNDMLFKQASRLRGAGYDKQIINGILELIGKTHLPKPLTVKDLETISESVTKYAKGAVNQFSLVDDKGKVSGIDVMKLMDWLIETYPMVAIGGELLVYRDGYYSEQGVFIREIIKKQLPPKYVSYHKIHELYKLLCDDIRIQTEYKELNKRKDIVNLRNGVYYLKEESFKEHLPEYQSTVQINVDFKQTDKELKDTLIGEFLYDIAGLSSDDVDMLMEYMTYILTMYANKKCMLYLIGPSNTGKSVLIKIIETMVGMKNVSNIGLHELNQRFYPAELRDKLLNSNADNSSVALSGIENLKKITGQDSIMHERKGQNPFFFVPFAKLVFSFNQLPLQLEEKSDAFYKRLRILKMGKKIHLTQDYVDRLCSYEETTLVASILLRKYGKKMAVSNQIINSGNSQLLTNQLRASSDTVEAFFQDKLTVHSEAWIEKRTLYDEYIKYCVDKDRKHSGLHSFYKNMISRGYDDHRKSTGSKHITVYKGVGLDE